MNGTNHAHHASDTKQDVVYVFELIRDVLKEDIYRTDLTRVGKIVRTRVSEGLPGAVEAAQSALTKAVQLLHELEVYNDRLLPYRMQVVIRR